MANSSASTPCRTFSANCSPGTEEAWCTCASPAGAAEEIALPIRAVQQAGDGSRFVWKVSGDSVVRTAVATGRLVNNAVTITAGIQAGDRIVTDGMQKIGQGSKVIAE